MCVRQCQYVSEAGKVCQTVCVYVCVCGGGGGRGVNARFGAVRVRGWCECQFGVVVGWDWCECQFGVVRGSGERSEA